MKVKSFNFRKKNDKRCVEGFGMLKKRYGLHVDLKKEVNSIVENNEEEKDVDDLEEKQVKMLLGIEINNNNNNKRNNNNEWSWGGVVGKKKKNCMGYLLSFSRRFK